MVVMYGIKTATPSKRPAAGWTRTTWSTASMITVPMDLMQNFLHNAIKELGWEALLNTRGTTWRKLDESLRAGIVDGDSRSQN